MEKLVQHKLTTKAIKEMLSLPHVKEFKISSNTVTIKFEIVDTKSKKIKKDILSILEPDKKKSLTFTYNETQDLWLLTGFRETTY